MVVAFASLSLSPAACTLAVICSLFSSRRRPKVVYHTSLSRPCSFCRPQCTPHLMMMNKVLLVKHTHKGPHLTMISVSFFVALMTLACPSCSAPPLIVPWSWECAPSHPPRTPSLPPYPLRVNDLPMYVVIIIRV
jgi:hypothetical protein